MILKIDASQLEWRSYIEWSRDPVGIEEIQRNVDVHSDNQRIFNLPSRLIAKIFLFRWIYRGSAYAFAHDPDFSGASSSEPFWQKVIDTANEKYHILYKFQNKLIDRAQDGEIITIPTGREYKFEMKQNRRKEWYWNIRDIVNWPNQGFAADLMVIARVSLFNRIKKFKEWAEGKIKMFNTVHDDIESDVDNDPELCYNISMTKEKVFEDIPANFEKLYKSGFVIPMAGEVSFGPNLQDLVKFKRDLGKGQFIR